MAFVGIVVSVLGALVLGSPLEVAATPQSASTTPPRYYLALGDSLTYGVQPAKVDAGLPPSRFDTGFVDVSHAVCGGWRRSCGW